MRYYILFSFFIEFLCIGDQLGAQEYLNPYWDMQSPLASYAASSSCTVSTLYPGNNFGNTVFLSATSSSTGYSGASGNWNASLAARSGPLQKEAMGSAYVEFSITPAPGFRFVFKSISFGVRSTQTGPRRWGLFHHENQYSLSLAQGALSNNSTWYYVTSNGINYSAAQAISIRIYAFDGEGSPAINVANWRLDDLTLQLEVMPDNLPVKWLYQRVKTVCGQVVVEWATQEESEVESFIVQRSANALHFENIARVSPQSITNSIPTNRFYRYVDSEPLPGRSFYRIIQKDISGSLEVGEILFIDQQVGKINSLKDEIIFSPTTGTIRLPANYSGPTHVHLFTMKGQLIAIYRLHAVGGIAHIAVPDWLRGYHVLVLDILNDSSRIKSFSKIIYLN